MNLDPAATRIRERIAQENTALHVPHLFDVEVLNVLRRHDLRGFLSPERARLALSRFSGLRLVRYPHSSLSNRIWELRSNLTAYDAAYIALAEVLEEPLVTTDARLARAPGHRARVELFS